MEAAGIAFRKTPFAQGAERFAHRGSEVAHAPQELVVSSRVCVSGLQSRPQHNGIHGKVVGAQGERWQVKLDTGEELALRSANLQIPSRLVRTGHWLVAKVSKYEELLRDRSFHETFCRLHEEARSLAAKFNERMHGGVSAFSIRFVRCSVYEGCYTDGRRLSVLAEQELEGEYLKYNNNAGTVRAMKPRASTPGHAAPLGMILEEEEDEEEDEEEPDPIETPQCFSHFSFVASDHEKLVCDLQGTWNATDGYLLTDPVVHNISLEKHANGATDKGLSGIEKFFDSHTCGPLCRKLRLPSPSECVELARDRLRRLELQKRREEEERRTLEERARRAEELARQREQAERQQRVQQQVLERQERWRAAAQQQMLEQQEEAQRRWHYVQAQEAAQHQRELQQREQQQAELRRQAELRQQAERNRLRREQQQQGQTQDCVIL